MLWIVGEENVHIKAVQAALQSVGQACSLFSEDACIRKLEAYFEDESVMLKKKLCIIASEISVALLEKLAGLFSTSFVHPGNNLTLIVLADPTSWISSLSNQHSDLQTAFAYRRVPVKQFGLLAAQNALMDFANRGKLRLRVVLLGLLFGGSGYHFYELLRSIWFEEFSLDPRYEELRINVPMMHIKRFEELFVNLTSPDSAVSDYPVLVPAFDWQSQTLTSLMKEINQKINPKLEVTPAVPAGDAETTTEVANMVPTDSPTYQLLQTFQPYDVSSLARIMGEESPHSLSNNVSAVWDEFLTANGLQPVNVYVAGPTKSTKTEHAKAIAERFKLAFSDIVSAAVTILSWSEEQVNFLCGQNALDLALVQQFQRDLNGALEAKLNEGKKGKDKGAPVESKVDVNLVTEPVVSALAPEIRQKVIGLWFTTSSVCKRRGCVWDVWDKGFLNELKEVYEAIHVFDLKSEVSEEVASNTKKQPPIDVVVELQCDDKWLVSRYNDYLTAQQVKPKEAQALVKTFEGTVAAYFSSLTQDAGVEGSTTTPLSTHSKISAFLQDFAHVLHVRPVLSSALGQPSSLEEVLVSLQRSIEKARGKSIGWISALPADPVDQAAAAAQSSPEDAATKPPTASAAAIVEEVESNGELNLNSLDQKSKDRLAIKAEAISSFLSNTILPVLSQAVIDVMRKQPEDPIMYVADLLAQVSEKNQTEALENARTKFYELLNATS
eukprot:gene33298-40282_t